MRKFIVTIEGNQYEVGVEEILTDGATVAPVVQEVKPQPQVQAQPKAAATNVSGTKMEAPMPGMIKAYKVAEGATVKKGDLLLEFDMEAIKAAGYEVITPVVICNADDYKDVIRTTGKQVEPGDTVMELDK